MVDHQVIKEGIHGIGAALDTSMEALKEMGLVSPHAWGPEALAKVLDAAHDVLLTEGWIRKAIRTEDGYCAMGAIHEGAKRLGHMSWGRPTTQALAAHLDSGGKYIDIIPLWNDMPNRTIDDVLDALRLTAKRLRDGDLTMDMVQSRDPLPVGPPPISTA